MKIRGAVLEEIGRARPFARTHPITVSDVDLAPPGDGEILVRVEAAGICHSDLSVVNGDRQRPVPMLLGHEAAGIIESVGAGVELAVGTRVVMTFMPRCGHCSGCRSNGRTPCSAGTAANTAGTLLGGETRLQRDGQAIKHHLGVSGFASHTVVDHRSVVPVGADVPPDVAALLGCAVLTGGGAVLNAAAPRPDESIMVIGLGGVGMAAILTAVSLSSGEVIGADSVPGKRKTALDLGATAVYSPQELIDAGIKAPVVIEAAGNARAFDAALAATEPGGTTVTVGLPAPGARVSIPPLLLVAQARTIIGSYLGSAVPARDIPIYEQMWREGRFPVDKLVSSHIELDNINEAMDTLADGSVLRQIIDFAR